MPQPYLVNVSVASHYRQASYASEVVTQSLLGEEVELLEAGELFSRVRQADGYVSWISSDQLVQGTITAGMPVAMVRQHFLGIHKAPKSAAPRIREAVIGSRLAVANIQGDWSEVLLPDGEKGWAPRSGFGECGPPSPPNVLSLAEEFLGYQYFWGGRSPKGFDCSGLVQTVFGLLGIRLHRDSWQQQQLHVISDNWQDAVPGDLLFFARNSGQVSHVAIAKGDGGFLHASGWVRCNSLREGDTDFSARHLQTFVSVNRYL